MKLHILSREQLLGTDIDTAWDFFSSPINLKKITPAYLGFEITSELSTQSMYEGQIISYKVSPLAGIKMTWVTEITHVEDRKYFVDEQRFGPYSMWHHEHWFYETREGVLMKDKVTYALPWYGMGRLGHRLIVQPKLEEIFNYRAQLADNIFPTNLDTVATRSE